MNRRRGEKGAARFHHVAFLQREHQMRHRRTALLALAFFAFTCPLISAAPPKKPAAPLPTIQVAGGIVDYQVLPRDENDKAAINMVGLCYPGTGVIEARLLDRGAPVEGLDWAKAGQAADGKWTAELQNLPVGGPYDLEVRLLDNKGKPLALATLREILVGDLWILAGQSNMQGVGKVSELPAPIPQVHAFTMDDRWAIGREPLHALFESRDEAHWQGLVPKEKTLEQILPTHRKAARDPKARTVGPGLPFAWELYRLTGVPVGLIPCARGGTSLGEWSPQRKAEGGKSLYGAMLRRAAAVGRVRGVVWYQGESDTGNPEVSGTYLDRFCDFVAAVRSDLGDPNLCFLYVQLGRFVYQPGTEAGWDNVREAQRLAEAKLGRAAVVPAVDCSPDESGPPPRAARRQRTLRPELPPRSAVGGGQTERFAHSRHDSLRRSKWPPSL
jgi:sialate O-acetylesterase